MIGDRMFDKRGRKRYSRVIAVIDAKVLDLLMCYQVENEKYSLNSAIAEVLRKWGREYGKGKSEEDIKRLLARYKSTHPSIQTP